MIVRPEQFKTEVREHMRDGAGSVIVSSFVTAKELNDKGRLFGKLTLKPGCGIGYHVHEKDSELFYVLKGTATYSDNGEKKEIHAGEVTVTPAGTGHSVCNETDSDVELIALIVYAD